MRASWANDQKSIGNLIDSDGHIIVVENGHPMWGDFLMFGDKIDPAPIVEQDSSTVELKMSFAQLLIGLVSEAFITEQEAELWLQGQLPQPVLETIDTLPLASRFAAKVKATRPSEVLRADPIVWAMADSKGMTPEQLDQFFINYSAV